MPPTVSAADRLTGSGKMFARRCSRALIEMDRIDDVPAIDTRRSIVAVASPGHRHPTSIHRRELLQVGYSGLLGISLSSLAARPALAAGTGGTSGRSVRKPRSVLLVFLTGAP